MWHSSPLNPQAFIFVENRRTQLSSRPFLIRLSLHSWSNATTFHPLSGLNCENKRKVVSFISDPNSEHLEKCFLWTEPLKTLYFEPCLHFETQQNFLGCETFCSPQNNVVITCWHYGFQNHTKQITFQRCEPEVLIIFLLVGIG